MRKTRLLVIPFLLFFLLGCGLLSGVQNIQNIKNAASTELPAILTSAPTEQGLMETAAAGVQTQISSTNNCTGTPTSGGLGVSVETTKTVLSMTQQFNFADGTADGKPAVVATLTGTGATAFPALAAGFSAQFIGDPCNLDHIIVTIPRTDLAETADQGMGILNIVLAGTLPPQVQLGFLTWVTTNYANIAVGSQQQTTFDTMQFTLKRDQANMVLDIVPTPK